MKVSVYIHQHIGAEIVPGLPDFPALRQDRRAIDFAPPLLRNEPSQHYNSVIIRRELRHPDQIIDFEYGSDRSTAEKRRKLKSRRVTPLKVSRYQQSSTRTRDDPPGKPNDDEALY